MGKLVESVVREKMEDASPRKKMTIFLSLSLFKRVDNVQKVQTRNTLLVKSGILQVFRLKSGRFVFLTDPHCLYR